jgi:hypothetical protein
MFVGDAAELLIIAQQLGAGLWSAASSHVCAAAAAPEFSPMTAVSAATSSGTTAARVAAVSLEPSSSSAAARAATFADSAAASDAAAMAGISSTSAAARAATDIASEASAVTTHGSAAACAAAAIFTSPSTSAAACAATFSGSAAAGDAAAPVSGMVRAVFPATAVATAAASASVSELKAIFGHNSKAERAWCSLADRLVASVTAVGGWRGLFPCGSAGEWPPQCGAPAASGEWCVLAEPLVGSRVIVIEEIASCNEVRILLPAGSKGIVTAIDSEGDLEVFWPCLGPDLCCQWIELEDLASLSTLVECSGEKVLDTG